MIDSGLDERSVRDDGYKIRQCDVCDKVKNYLRVKETIAQTVLHGSGDASELSFVHL